MRRRIDGFAQKLTLEHRGQDDSRAACRWSANSRSRMRWSSAGLAIGPAARPTRCSPRSNISKGAKGRLERVGERNGAPIFVDYAHKPDALAKALQALRPYAKRKLVVVFGAGGDRDAGKRPLMGAIASENADSVIVTDDNPRSENPAAIRAAILDAAKGAQRDRRSRARRSAPRSQALQPGDALLDRGQRPRDRPDRRRQDLAVQRSRGGRGRARAEGRMSAIPLWTSQAMAEAMRAATSGALPDGVTGLSIDSRTIAPGEAYFAIKGDVHDGHDFVDAALKAGAALAVVERAQRGKFAADARLLIVDDVLAGLARSRPRLARAAEGAGDRGHRLGRQDLDQGSAAPRAVARRARRMRRPRPSTITGACRCRWRAARRSRASRSSRSA